MIRSILFPLFIASVLSVNAQKNTTKVVTDENIQLYRQALQSGDANTAIFALNRHILNNPETSYIDTLSLIYYNTNQAAPSLYWVNKRMEQPNADKKMLMALKAQCLQALGDPVQAISNWEELLKSDPNKVEYLWALLNLQYNIKRQAEALVTVEKLAKQPIEEKARIAYTQREGKTLYTPLKAAIQVMKGNILYELSQKNESKNAFAEALKIDGENLQAKQNLQVVEIELAEASKKKDETPATGKK